MLDIICTRKEKTWLILFFEIYEMVLIIFKSENCSYTGDPPKNFIEAKNRSYIELCWVTLTSSLMDDSSSYS